MKDFDSKKAFDSTIGFVAEATAGAAASAKEVFSDIGGKATKFFNDKREIYNKERQIAEADALIEQLFYDLGRATYSGYCDTPLRTVGVIKAEIDAAFEMREQCENVDSKSTDVPTENATVDSEESVVYCTHCGTKYTADKNFCSKCGSSLEI